MTTQKQPLRITLRSTAYLIMKIAQYTIPPDDQEWITAMGNELSHIDKGFEALAFSIGCLRSALHRKLAAEKLEPLGRWFVVTCIFIWAGLKIYLGGKAGASIKIDLAGWQVLLILGSSIAYIGAAIFLFARQWFALAGSLFLAFMLNSAHLFFTAFGQPIFAEHNTSAIFSLAVISEESFILTLTLVGAIGLWAWPNIFNKKQQRVL